MTRIQGSIWLAYGAIPIGASKFGADRILQYSVSADEWPETLPSSQANSVIFE